ncbi:Kiwa anti-phage protein KwaB-like domain-containing protein [Paenibacillus sp. NPDC058367]|uniref:Kiwa anti-phage protein KwaB-like domain-containing protein n=1 Tax=Paenibacillus sp. NPDC058367 TaxID=3346460 RepID=UPI00365445A1
MDINNENNLLWKLSELTDDKFKKVNLSLSLVKKQKESDAYYQSSETALAPDVKKWLKEFIVESLDKLKVANEEGIRKFAVCDYNHEITKNESIAKYDVSLSPLKDKKNKLVASIRNPDPMYVEKDSLFQMVKVAYDNEFAYFCFYKGIKKNGARTKRWVSKSSNQFEFINETIIELGGSISFIIIDNCIFIRNVTNFEYAFDYTDHITKLRDENLTNIISMPFFEGESANKELFETSCKKYLFSRGLAQIKPQTLAVLQNKFEARCDELAKIKRKAPTNPEKREEYIEKFGSVWKLLEYIDVEQYKIKFSEGVSPTPLIHFFADKIAKSFLTEDYRVVMAYD